MNENTTHEEITIKFGKGLAEGFTSKDGKELVRVKIPNSDPNDRSPWASFVLPAKAVHENQYGKGLWAKLPADGKTTISQSVKLEDGSWTRTETVLSNEQIKILVEAYKTKGERGADTAGPKSSVISDLKEKKKESADRSEFMTLPDGLDEEGLPFR